MEVKKEHIDKIFNLAKLSLTFAKVNRITHHEDGIRNESDTDHTFMLSLISCSLADTFYKDKLDIGLISQFALVHDLVEVYANDTNTFIDYSEVEKNQKKERENESLQRIKNEFDFEFPWISNMIEKYEKLDTSEARFIKILDKVMPGILHTLNNSKYLIDSGKDEKYFTDFFNIQFNSALAIGYEFPEIIELLKIVSKYQYDLFIKNKI